MWQVDGFAKAEENVADAMQRLQLHIQDFPARLQQFKTEKLLSKPAPGKWSRQEILGHLIDSAINNLKRFTDIQFAPQPSVIVGYQQVELVIANNYQNLPLEHLLILWQSLNRQIVYAVANIPAEKLEYPVNPQYEAGEMKTLAWLICDYVAHMEHHFRQIFV
jgi:hypothetical protein